VAGTRARALQYHFCRTGWRSKNKAGKLLSMLGANAHPWITLAVVVLAGGTGCGETYVLMHEDVLVDETGVHEFGSGCEELGGGGGDFGTGAAGADGTSFGLTHRSIGDGEGVEVRVFGAGSVELVRKIYTEGFLETGEVDEFEVALSPTVRLRLKYWGATSCDPS